MISPDRLLPILKSMEKVFGEEKVEFGEEKVEFVEEKVEFVEEEVEFVEEEVEFVEEEVEFVEEEVEFGEEEVEFGEEEVGFVEEKVEFVEEEVEFVENAELVKELALLPEIQSVDSLILKLIVGFSTFIVTFPKAESQVPLILWVAVLGGGNRVTLRERGMILLTTVVVSR